MTTQMSLSITKFQVAATALNLSVQEYLERVAALIYSGQDSEVDQSQGKTPYELGKDFIGKIDSRILDSSVKPHKTAFGELYFLRWYRSELPEGI